MRRINDMFFNANYERRYKPVKFEDLPIERQIKVLTKSAARKCQHAKQKYRRYKTLQRLADSGTIAQLQAEKAHRLFLEADAAALDAMTKLKEVKNGIATQ